MGIYAKICAMMTREKEDKKIMYTEPSFFDTTCPLPHSSTLRRRLVELRKAQPPKLRTGLPLDSDRTGMFFKYKFKSYSKPAPEKKKTIWARCMFGRDKKPKKCLPKDPGDRDWIFTNLDLAFLALMNQEKPTHFWNRTDWACLETLVAPFLAHQTNRQQVTEQLPDRYDEVSYGMIPVESRPSEAAKCIRRDGGRCLFSDLGGAAARSSSSSSSSSRRQPRAVHIVPVELSESSYALGRYRDAVQKLMDLLFDHCDDLADMWQALASPGTLDRSWNMVTLDPRIADSFLLRDVALRCPGYCRTTGGGDKHDDNGRGDMAELQVDLVPLPNFIRKPIQEVDVRLGKNDDGDAAAAAGERFCADLDLLSQLFREEGKKVDGRMTATIILPVAEARKMKHMLDLQLAMAIVATLSGASNFPLTLRYLGASDKSDQHVLGWLRDLDGTNRQAEALAAVTEPPPQLPPCNIGPSSSGGGGDGSSHEGGLDDQFDLETATDVRATQTWRKKVMVQRILQPYFLSHYEALRGEEFVFNKWLSIVTGLAAPDSDSVSFSSEDGPSSSEDDDY